MQISFFQDHRGRSARSRSSVEVLKTVCTGNRYACLSLGTDRTQRLFGGGESDSTSPPKKKRRRSKSSDLGRRRKTSREPATTSSSVEDRRDELGNSPCQEATNSSPSAKQSEKRSAWRNSSRGKESIAKSREKYESSEKGRLTRQRYESNEGLETRRQYDASQQGSDRKIRYELSPGGEATRRRYKSEEGVLVRAAYSRSGDGISARRRTVTKYKNTKAGREAQEESRRRYELRESAKQRKLLYYKRQAYKKRVKKAVSHLVNRGLANKEEEQQLLNEENIQPDTARPEEQEPGEEECTSNKEAMAIIRSHKVSNFHLRL